MIKDKPERVDLNFIEFYQEIRNTRLANKKDKCPITLRRFTKAVANLMSNDDRLSERMLNAEIESDRRRI